MEAQSVNLSVDMPAEVPAALPVVDSPSWILVEDEGIPSNCYSVIQDQEVIGDLDLAQNKIRYSIDGSERYGVIHLISTDRDFVEDERNFMVMESTNPEFPELWALVNCGLEPHRVRIAMVGCKKVSPRPGKSGILLGLDEQIESFRVLHVLLSEYDLREELKYLQSHIMKVTMSVERDNEVEAAGLTDAYFLVQYYEDALNLIYAIVRYEDTIWKEDNQFPCVVAYIGTKELAHQCVILRKSFDVNELIEVLSLIRKTCNSMKYAQINRDIKAAGGSVMREG